MLTKEEYISLLDWGCSSLTLRQAVLKLIDENNELIEHAEKLQDEVDKYKHEYFSMCDLIENPQPYKFEDLKVGMFVFDCVKKRVNKIIEIFDSDFGVPYIKFDDGFEEWVIIEFKEERFFPVTKAMEYQK